MSYKYVPPSVPSLPPPDLQSLEQWEANQVAPHHHLRHHCIGTVAMTTTIQIKLEADSKGSKYRGGF